MFGVQNSQKWEYDQKQYHLYLKSKIERKIDVVDNSTIKKENDLNFHLTSNRSKWKGLFMIVKIFSSQSSTK